MLPLMLTAVKANRLSLARLTELMFDNPRRIYDLPEQPDTFIEVDPDVSYTLSNEDLYSKCGWNPFVGQALTGRVERVTLRGQLVYDVAQPTKASKILASPGSGRIIPA